MRYDEAILAELRDIHALLKQLFQPHVTVDERPFGDRGIDAPIGTILKHLRSTPLPDKWAYCEGGLAPKDMHEMLGSDQLPDFTAADHRSQFCHIIRVSPG